MNPNRYMLYLVTMLLLAVSGCAGGVVKPEIETASAEPAGSITRGETTLQLTGKPIRIGDPLPGVFLVDAGNMKAVDLSKEKGNVFLLSIVPSLDTKVCEAQTHYLGEAGDRLPGDAQTGFSSGPGEAPDGAAALAAQPRGFGAYIGKITRSAEEGEADED